MIETIGWIVGGAFGTGILLLIASVISWRLKWAMLVDKDKLPPILQKNHDDWWWFLRWIPRRLTAWVGGKGNPIQLLGTNPKGHNQDVPAPNTWCLSWPIYVAWVNGRVFGLGIRRDYVDLYWTLRVSFHKND